MKFIHFTTAMGHIENIKLKLKTKELFLMESLNYTLAQDIIAKESSPAYPTSAMDGYAIKYEDIPKKRLKIIAINPAGSLIEEKVEVGTCIKTFTGSLIPKGANTIIPIENVIVDGDEIIIKESLPKGFFIREVGENYTKGEVLIEKGTTIDFPQIGVMAGLNIENVLVYEKPKVGIISTGSEVLCLGEKETNKAQIRSSNNYTIEAMVKKYGGEALQFGCVKDDKESITKALKKALEYSDIVVTTGGVSVGDYDFVKDVIEAINFEIIFKGVNMKPGQHVMLAKKDNKIILGLPGFAYSATITSFLFLTPLIKKFQNIEYKFKKVKATLEESFMKRSKKEEFSACNYTIKRDGKYYINFKGKKTGTSAILTNMLGEVALIETSEDDKSKDTGDEVTMLLF